MRNYKCLSIQTFQNSDFHIEPIREEDKYAILKIRNEQIFHLRQPKPLTVVDQENYFSNVVAKLFEQDYPNQLLFSFFYKKEFVGYGGLVHINWIDKNAEISFIMKTELEKDYFSIFWINYLHLIEKVAFNELRLHKIFTYAFDLRPHLYTALEQAKFKEEARLKEHCLFNGNYYDVVFHSKINDTIYFRKATDLDVDQYFEWANDELVRNFSYQTATISYESHVNWFTSKLNDSNCYLFIFENDIKQNIGQIRIQKNNNQAVIGISIDKNHRGKNYAYKMIKLASENFLIENPDCPIEAYIKTNNKSSVAAFEKAGYSFKEKLMYQNIESYLYTLSNENK
ncbi:Acyl-CoA N-acyltransferase [Flavobacterium indicum GPTSA100-9 = DSM 17447]|uniref:Acyl-CoA N-acyltransferase n=1 Tax=Flavobacterium indicum (strain DSM 17447 / CIP 109464 / GPTSA100-9) TaxID=1094466 RepID=H8XUE2_FLAIG|nr:GNAT family N-acetyltransferase [Flavobacterium indicum]CCG52925.1 Acyl-CoA N-acyltransferase [Flavobacterium indicum GPTSA100-9 = DSM 17447]